jgi:hypothetical protein
MRRVNADKATRCPHTDRPRFGSLGTCKLCFYKHPSRERASKCAHTDLAVFALGLCRNCYSVHRRRNPYRLAVCAHKNRGAYAFDLCQSCAHLAKKYRLDRRGLARVAATKRCRICKTDFRRASDKHVDHDHASGAVRGVLCGNCNRAIGLFQNDPRRLRTAAAYLTTVPEWATGFPLGAEGHVGKRYRK